MNREIFRLAIPNLLANLTVPLVGLADTMVMGQIAENPALYLGAIGLGGTIFNTIYWSVGFLRMGVTGITAQAYGAKDFSAQAHTFGRGFGLAIILGLALMVLQVPLEWLAFKLLHGEAEVEAVAAEYFRIRIWAAPAALGLMALNGWFLGMQNTRFPLYITIVVNGINVLLNILLALGLDMRAEGVALATVIANYTGLALGVALATYRYRANLITMSRRSLIALAPLKHFFAINGNIFIRTVCLTFVFAFFTDRSAAAGGDALAVNQMLIQFFFLMSYGIDGFAFAAESLVGKFKGSGETSSLRKAISILLVWGIAVGIGYSIAYALAGPWVLARFTSEAELQTAALPYLPWLTALPIVSASAFIWDGVYIGATATAALRTTMILSTFTIFLPAYLLTASWGNHGIWFSMSLFMLGRGVLLHFWAKKSIYSVN
ncbi:MAG: MATE family efflux transporter [Bacteroidia bacterium]